MAVKGLVLYEEIMLMNINKPGGDMIKNIFYDSGKGG